MPMGYCKRCDRFIAITAKAPPVKPGETPKREPSWYPVPHDGPDGKLCDGHETAL